MGKLPRDVRIESVVINGRLVSYFVRFIKRSKYQRHLAAQFDANFVELDYVKNWVKNNKKINLIE